METDFPKLQSITLSPTTSSSLYMDERRPDNAPAAWLHRAALFLVTLSSAVAVYRAAGDAASVAFVIASYLTLLLLFLCLRAYELAPPGEAGGRRDGLLRRAVWALSTLLTMLFSWRVAALMPYWPVALLVWALAAATTVGGFVALFHRRP
ncbi:unnamed protein product [Urochloa decumbens]|uniref:Uncharacterized protein n=1 Tax=Urochloa decumbens TaxID=240449 RepID=A0ABC9DCC4_9POAL